MIIIIEGLLSSITYKADGSQKVFSIPFDYLRSSFIHVQFDNVEQLTGFTVANRTVEFDTAPTTDVLVTIYRVTPTEPLVGWVDASVIKALDMTVAQVQQLHIIEENKDWSRTNSVVLEDNAYNMKFHRVINVADPQDPQDVVTKNYMETVQGGFVQQNQALVQQATQQAGIATTKAGEASASASAAKTSETNAQKWAESATSPDDKTDADSPTGATMSSKKWALYAKQLAINIGNPVVSTTESKGTITVQKSDGTKNTISVLTPSMKNVANGVAGLKSNSRLDVNLMKDLPPSLQLQYSTASNGYVTIINNNENLNNYIKAGTFECQGAVTAKTLQNCPYIAGNFRLLVICNASVGYGTQMIISNGTDNAIYIRSFRGGSGVSFTAWSRLTGIIEKSYAINGYEVTNGGLQYVFGSVGVIGANGIIHTFSKPFTHACLIVLPVHYNSSTTKNAQVTCEASWTTTNVTIRTNDAGVEHDFRYIAIGY